MRVPDVNSGRDKKVDVQAVVSSAGAALEGNTQSHR
jgi:hypothetical protein